MMSLSSLLEKDGSNVLEDGFIERWLMNLLTGNMPAKDGSIDDKDEPVDRKESSTNERHVFLSRGRCFNTR